MNVKNVFLIGLLAFAMGLQAQGRELHNVINTQGWRLFGIDRLDKENAWRNCPGLKVENAYCQFYMPGYEESLTETLSFFTMNESGVLVQHDIEIGIAKIDRYKIGNNIFLYEYLIYSKNYKNELNLPPAGGVVSLTFWDMDGDGKFELMSLYERDTALKPIEIPAWALNPPVVSSAPKSAPKP